MVSLFLIEIFLLI